MLHHKVSAVKWIPFRAALQRWVSPLALQRSVRRIGLPAALLVLLLLALMGDLTSHAVQYVAWATASPGYGSLICPSSSS